MSPAARYLAFWTLGCTTGFVVGLRVLHRRDALGWRTATALGLAWLGLFVGSKWHFRLEQFPLWEAIAIGPAELFAPGRHLPLGLLTGAVAAGLWCLVSRAPWRETGDALAVAASVVIPIGRLGCLTFGCCMGGVCPAWLHGLCVRHPPGSEAYTQQLQARLIPLDASLSLPAHPLPLYFAVASLVTLGLLLWLLRRGAAPGTLLAVFCVVRPATKLLLEPLRATAVPSRLMVAVPVGMLAVTLATLAGMFVARRLRLRRRAPALAVPMLMLLLVPAPSSAAPPPGELPDEWKHALMDYAADPARNGRALRALRRENPEGLPPLVLFALADQRLRAGNRAAAARLFETVLSLNPGEPWTGWAALGLGWVEATKSPERARERFAALARSSSPSGPLARLAEAFLDLRAGEMAAARRGFEEVAARRGVSPALAQVASLGTGYTRYWDGEYRPAAEAFDLAASGFPDGRLTDDARYAAAVARWRLGLRSDATAALRDLADVSGSSGADDASPRAVLWLERRALIRPVGAFRRTPFRVPEDRLIVLFDRDGAAMARGFLTARGDPAMEARRVRLARPVTMAPSPSPVRAVAPAPARSTKPAATSPVPGPGSRPWLAAVGALLAMGLLWAWARRRTAK
jgi:hypothetical protein